MLKKQFFVINTKIYSIGGVRTLAKTAIGFEENITNVLSYFLMPLSSIIILLVEKQNKTVRFHAMQATILGIILSVAYVISGVLVIVLIGLLLLPLIGLISFILWLFLMFKAYKGEKYKLPVIGDFAEKQMGKI